MMLDHGMTRLSKNGRFPRNHRILTAAFSVAIMDLENLQGRPRTIKSSGICVLKFRQLLSVLSPAVPARLNRSLLLRLTGAQVAEDIGHRALRDGHLSAKR